MKKIIGACVATAAAVGFAAGTLSRGSARANGLPGFAAKIYTANTDGNSVSALGGPALDRAVGDIGVDMTPKAIALSHDATTVYTGNNGDGSATISLFDARTNSGVQTFTLANGDLTTDLVVAPDDSVVYATLRNAGAVKVFDTATQAVVRTYPLPSIASSSPDPEAIDVSPDGLSLFVLNVADARVEKLAAADGASLGHADVSGSAREIRVSADGAVLVVVGAAAPQFFFTGSLLPVAGASSADFGSQVDVAVAQGRAYVLNDSFAGGGPPPSGEPSLDVYEAATGLYVRSFGLGAGAGVLGIAVTADGLTAYVTRAGFENVGSATAVDLTSGALGPTGNTGANPRRVAVIEGAATPVVTYFLPRIVSLSLKGDGRDSLTASGFFDDGGLDVDYLQPVTIEVDRYSQTFTLVPNKKGTAFIYKALDKTLTFQIVPNLKGSSLGKFTMKVAKGTLSQLIDPTGAVTFHFHASGLADARGEVALTTGKYRLGGKRGSLTLPQFFPAKALAKLGGEGLDSLSFRGGFATNGNTPEGLGVVRFALGPTFSRTIPGGSFHHTGDVFKYSDKQGAAKFSITLNFFRETVTVNASKIELGPLSGETVDVVLDAGGGAGAFRNTVRLGSKGKNKAY